MNKNSADYFLAEALEVAARIRKTNPTLRVGDRPTAKTDAVRLAALMRALDRWITSGGGLELLPARWRPIIRIPLGKKR